MSLDFSNQALNTEMPLATKKHIPPAGVILGIIAPVSEWEFILLVEISSGQKITMPFSGW